MANHLARATTLWTAGLACAGCIAIWQSDHKIEASTGLAVTIDYDPLLLTPEGVASTAQSECRKFQRVAVFDNVRKGKTWTRVADFRCEKDALPLKGSVASFSRANPAAGTTYRCLPPPFPDAAPRVAVSQVGTPPAIPPTTAPPIGGVATVPTSHAASVHFIDASDVNSGVTRRHITKPQTPGTQVANALIVSPSSQHLTIHSGPMRNLKMHHVPVAALKGSLAS
jgi:hypothetical protein